MQIDVEDILASAFGRIIKQAFLFLITVWVGTMIGGLALGIGEWRVDYILSIWLSPLLLFSAWLVVNIAVLTGGLGYLLVCERPGIRAYGILAGVESFFVVAGWFADLKDAGSMAVAWLSWLLMVVFLGIGVRLIQKQHLKRWARELARIDGESVHRQAELEVLARLRSPVQGE